MNVLAIIIITAFVLHLGEFFATKGQGSNSIAANLAVTAGWLAGVALAIWQLA